MSRSSSKPSLSPSPLFASAAIAACVLVAFHNTLAVPFQLDDEISLLENDTIRHLWPLGPVLFPPTTVFFAGRPLLNLSFALNHAISGMSLAGFHAVNLAIHVAAALVLGAIVRRTLHRPGLREKFAGRADWIALASATLWAVHPLQTNSVTYLSQRAESLMGLCYLLTLYAFIRSVDATEQDPARGARSARRWKLLAVASCFAGAATKEVIATAPLLVLLYDRTFVAGTFIAAWRARGRLHLALAASWLLIGFLMITTRVEDRGVGFAFDYTPARYALLSCVTQAKYLALSFWPFPLIFDRGPDGPAPGGWIALAGIVFALGAIAATLVLLRRAPRWAFVCCWFFVILLPTTSVIPVAGQPVGENRVYLSLAAAMVTLVLAVDHFARRASLSLLVGGIVALATLTIARNRVYATELSLWQDTLRKVPGNSRAHQYYGSALARANRMDEALREFEVSLRIRPTHFTYGKLGFALFEKGRLDEARQALEIAVKLAPDYPGHRANLGGVYFQLGRWPDALAQLQRAVELAPRHVHARTNLGVILGRMGRYREAIAEFERVQALDPTNAEALRSLPQLRALAASASAPPR